MENLEKNLEHQSLPELKIGNHRSVLPIVQGGMGIGISTAELAGTVSLYGGIGTLSAAALHLTPPYREYRLQIIKQAKAKTLDHKLSQEESRQLFKEANCHCIQEEIKKAKEISQGKPIFINIMVASKDYDILVQAACEGGVDGIVSGAGLPVNLPELTKDYPDVALIPILSDVRGVKLLLERYWKKHGKSPDAIVIEAPSTAGGHLGAKNLEEIYRDDTKLENSLPAVRAYLDSIGLHHVPVIAAGGIDTRQDIDKALTLGASGVQLGTRFLASKESGANEQFKNSLIHATKDDIDVIRSSAGLPFRVLKESGIFTRIGGPKDRVAHTRECIRDCLTHCGFKQGNEKLTQMCIVKELVRSTKGGKEHGLMSTGDYFDEEGNSKITSILPVKEIMELLQK